MRCLVVDDSVLFLEEAQRTLEREGITVVGVARTSAEALEKVAAIPIELLLLDIDLGGESGFQLLATLVRGSRLGAARVILISAHTRSDFADLIEASAAAGFISKTELSASAIYDVLELPQRCRITARPGT